MPVIPWDTKWRDLPESQVCSSTACQSFVTGAEKQKSFQLQDAGIQFSPSDKIPFLSKLLSDLSAMGGLLQFPASPQSKGQWLWKVRRKITRCPCFIFSHEHWFSWSSYYHLSLVSPPRTKLSFPLLFSTGLISLVCTLGCSQHSCWAMEVLGELGEELQNFVKWQPLSRGHIWSMNMLNVSPKQAYLRGTWPSYPALAAHHVDMLQDPAIEQETADGEPLQ